MDNGRGLNTHILTASGTMMGVCLTAISLVKLLENHANTARQVDEYLALDILLFTASALTSYFSIRYTGRRRAARLEVIADNLFVLGLVLMAVCATLFAFEII